MSFLLFTGCGREEIVIQVLNEGVDFSVPKGENPMHGLQCYPIRSAGLLTGETPR